MRRALIGHTVETACEHGSSELSNGALLAAAEAAAFDVLLTTGRSLPHQQEFSGRRIAIVVLPTTRWPQIQRRIAEIADSWLQLDPVSIGR